MEKEVGDGADDNFGAFGTFVNASNGTFVFVKLSQK